MDVNRQTPSSEEKVDALLLPTDSRGHYIVIYNVNLPMRLFATDATSTAALERVKNLLERDFANAEATFQFTASYLLFHPATRQFRTWTGSFYPRGNAPAMLSTFQTFRPNTFVQFGLDSVVDVEDGLRNWAREDTGWVFHEIISVIVNVQTLVSQTHPLVSKFPNSTHGQKRHIVFALP